MKSHKSQGTQGYSQNHENSKSLWCLKSQETQGYSQNHEISKSLWCFKNPVMPVFFQKTNIVIIVKDCPYLEKKEVQI